MPAGLKMTFLSDLDLLLGGPALRLPTLGLAVTLLALAILDLKYFWLPDAVTLPLLAGGLAVNALGLGPGFENALTGAIAGFACLSLIRLGYRGWRGHDGLGRGDAKLLAAIGAWVGWQPLPFVPLLAALLGLAAVCIMTIAGRKVRAQDRLPFGVMLALSGASAWVRVIA